MTVLAEQKQVLMGRFKTLAWILSALFLLQLVYICARFFFAANPAPILLSDDALFPAELVISTAPALESTLLDRPLFWKSRRVKINDDEVELVIENYSIELNNITLKSITRSGESGFVIITDQAGKTQRLALNDKIGAWEITTIEAREIEVSKSGETKVLTLEYADF